MKKLLVSSCLGLAALVLLLSLWGVASFNRDTDEASQSLQRAEKAGDSDASTGKVQHMEPKLSVVQEPSERPTRPVEPAAVSDTSENRVNIITGYVYDEKTKEGIPGVSLRAVVVSGGDTSEKKTFEAEAPTDSSGFYQIKGGTFEECSVICSASEGYCASSLEQSRVVRLGKGTTAEGVDFTLEREAPLSGIVVDLNGRSIEGAAVVIGGGQGHIYLRKSTDSTADGSFSFGCLPPTGDVHIQARKGDELVSQSRALVLPEEGITGLVITVLPQSAISGTVVDPDGIPLQGIRIISMPRPVSRLGGPTAVSDSAGRVGEEEVKTVDLNIPEASGAIEGIVTLRGESPRYLQVKARIETGEGEEQYWTNVAEDGQYRLENVVSGIGTVTAHAGLQSGNEKKLSLPVQVGRGAAPIHRDFFLDE